MMDKLCNSYEEFEKYVIVDVDASSKIVSAKFKPDSPYNRIDVFYFHTYLRWYYRENMIEFRWNNDSLFHGIDIEKDGNSWFWFWDGWNFDNDTKKILNGNWRVYKYKPGTLVWWSEVIEMWVNQNFTTMPPPDRSVEVDEKSFDKYLYVLR